MKPITAFALGVFASVGISVCLGFSSSTKDLKISQYKIIEVENRIQELERCVQNEINAGWVPQGGPVVSELTRGNTTVVYLHQAMVK